MHYFTQTIKNNLSPVPGNTLSVSDYGNLWKMDGPTEVCKEDTVTLEENCGDEVRNETVIFLCLHRNNKQLNPFKMCIN